MRFHGSGAPRLSRAFSTPLCFEQPGDKPGGGDPPKDPPKAKEEDPPKAKDDDEPKLTQSQVNAIVKRRAQDLIKAELGVDDLGAVKQLLKDAEGAKDAAKTQAEKDRDKAVADALTAERQKHQEELSRITTEATARTIEAEVRSIARVMNFHDPDDAWLRLADQVGEDDSTIKVGDDGKVTGAQEALDKLAKDKPYLLKTEKAAGPGSPNPGGGGDGNLDTKQRMERGAMEIVFGSRRRGR